jgi:hypothetical protein
MVLTVFTALQTSPAVKRRGVSFQQLIVRGINGIGNNVKFQVNFRGFVFKL